MILTSVLQRHLKQNGKNNANIFHRSVFKFSSGSCSRMYADALSLRFSPAEDLSLNTDLELRILLQTGQ